MSNIQEKINFLKKELQSSNLLAVSKTKPIEMVIEAYKAGQRDFGENKVQELLTKSQQLSHLKDIRWHFIGHLQSNKINNLLQVENLVSIHSIDSIKLLNKLLSKKVDKKLGLFLQINTSDEDEKYGFSDFELITEACHLLSRVENFYLQGIMTIGRIRTDDFEGDAKKSFRELCDLKHQLDKKLGTSLELSMGMSSDYKWAVEFGSTWIRIGSDIFGSRDK